MNPIIFPVICISICFIIGFPVYFTGYSEKIQPLILGYNIHTVTIYDYSVVKTTCSYCKIWNCDRLLHNNNLTTHIIIIKTNGTTIAPEYYTTTTTTTTTCHQYCRYNVYYDCFSSKAFGSYSYSDKNNITKIDVCTFPCA